MFGADCGIVIDVGKPAGSTDRNSCGIWKTWFSSVVFSVTRTLPWNEKMCEMSLRPELSGAGRRDADADLDVEHAGDAGDAAGRLRLVLEDQQSGLAARRCRAARCCRRR